MFRENYCTHHNRLPQYDCKNPSSFGLVVAVLLAMVSVPVLGTELAPALAGLLDTLSIGTCFHTETYEGS